MNRESLILFIKRILEYGSGERSAVSLKQLQTILETQGADPEMVRLVKDTLQSIPEAKKAAKAEPLTEESLRTAIRRAEERRAWEQARAERGRC